MGRLLPSRSAAHRHAAEPEIPILGVDLQRQAPVERQVDLFRRPIVETDLGLLIGDHFDSVADRPAIFTFSHVDEAELVGSVFRLSRILPVHFQREPAAGRRSLRRHGHAVAGIGVEFDERLIDLLVRRGANRYVGPFDCANVSLVLDRP